MIRNLILVGLFAASFATSASVPSTIDAKPIHITGPMEMATLP